MPYASKAQARKFHAMAARGEISNETVAEYDQSTDFSNLPERKMKKRKRRSFKDRAVAYGNSHGTSH